MTKNELISYPKDFVINDTVRHITFASILLFIWLRVGDGHPVMNFDCHKHRLPHLFCQKRKSGSACKNKRGEETNGTFQR